MNPYRRRPVAEPDFSGGSSEMRLRSASRASSASGQYPLAYTRVREILLGYLSPILVDSVLDKAMRSRNLVPSTLSASALADITGDIMVGLRLFVAAQRLPQLMLDLAEVLEQT